MKHSLIAAFAAMLACSPCQAADKLSESDLVGLGAIGAAYYADYRQTLDIKNHPNLHETNPILGQHPSDRKIANYFVASGVVTLGAVYLLPKHLRPYLIGGVLTVEIAVIGSNKRIGLHTQF